MAHLVRVEVRVGVSVRVCGLGSGSVVRLEQHVAHRVRQLQRRVEVVPVAVDERLAPHVPAQLAHELAGCVAVHVDPRLAQL